MDRWEGRLTAYGAPGPSRLRTGQHPLDFMDWIDCEWPGRKQMLQIKKRGILKNNASNRKLISDHYRKEFNRMVKEDDTSFEGWN